MAHAWQLTEFNIFTNNLDDALDGQQTNTTTDAVTDVRCCFCDQSVEWDYPPHSRRACDVRIYVQNHNCQGRQKEFGICNPVAISAASDVQGTTFDDLVDMGIKWIRTDLIWLSVETSKGNFNWGSYDRYVDLAVSKGLKILFILTYAPQWANGNASNKYPPTNPQDYANFCAAAVTRYSPKGVKHYEMWNEPNNYPFWQPAPNAVAYATMIKLAYPAMKAVDPNVTVISCGMAPVETDSTHTNPADYLQTLYDQGAGDCFDAVNFHPYSFPQSVGKGGWMHMWQNQKNLRDVMRRNGDGWKEIWMSEYGAPTIGAGTTEQQQADMIVAAIAESRRLPWAGPMFFYCYRDWDGTLSPLIENYYGIMYNNLTPKPARAAIKAAIAALVTT